MGQCWGSFWAATEPPSQVKACRTHSYLWQPLEVELARLSQTQKEAPGSQISGHSPLSVLFQRLKSFLSALVSGAQWLKG